MIGSALRTLMVLPTFLSIIVTGHLLDKYAGDEVERKSCLELFQDMVADRSNEGYTIYFTVWCIAVIVAGALVRLVQVLAEVLT